MVTQMVRALNMPFSGECHLEPNHSKREKSQPSIEDKHQLKMYMPENSSLSSIRFRSSVQDNIPSKSGDELLGSATFNVPALENQSALINHATVIPFLQRSDEFPAVSRPSAGSSKSALVVKDGRALKTLPKPEGRGNSTLLEPLVMEDKVIKKDGTVLIQAGGTGSTATVLLHSALNGQSTKNQQVTLSKNKTPEDVEIKVTNQVSAKDEHFSNLDRDEIKNLQQQNQSRCMSADKKYDERIRSLLPSIHIDQAEPQRNERLNTGVLQWLGTSVYTKVSCHTKSHRTQSRNVSGCRIYSESSQFHSIKKRLKPSNDRCSDVKYRGQRYHQKDKQIPAIATRRWYSYMRRLAANGRRRGHSFAAEHRLASVRSNNPHTTRRQLHQSHIIGQHAVLEKSRCIYSMRRQMDAQIGQKLALPKLQEDVQEAGTESATPRRRHPYPCDHKKRTEKESHATPVGTDERICHSGNDDFLTLDPGGRWGDLSSDKQGDANNKVCANSETESGMDEEFSATPSSSPCDSPRSHIVKNPNNLESNTAVTGSKKVLTSFATKIPSAVLDPQVQVDGRQSPDPSCTSPSTVSDRTPGGDAAGITKTTVDLEIGGGYLGGYDNPETPVSTALNEKRETSSNGNAKSCSCCVGELMNDAGCSMETIKVKEQIRHKMRIGFASTQKKTVYGLAIFYLRNMKQWEIEKLTLQTLIPFTPREKHVSNVLSELKYQGLKLGHVVKYFNREDSKREDILQLIDRIHPNCRFCSTQIQL